MVKWLADGNEVYAAKYAEAIESYGTPMDEIAEKFSTVIVFHPGAHPGLVNTAYGRTARIASR